MTADTYSPPLLDFVPGDTTGLAIPATPENLQKAGADFLTEAFRRFGSLAPDNRVTKITRFDPHLAGSTGRKVFLSVAYERDDPGLCRDLFVKFSRNFTQAHEDRRRFELESEIRLAQLSRVPNFPIKVAAPYFADFHSESGTGLLITEQIAFGTGSIEPVREKCMDHELADPLSYYKAILSTLAKLAAAHKAGRLDPYVDQLFPFSPEVSAAEDAIPYDEAGLRDVIAKYAAFAKNHPQLMPAPLTTPAFIAKLERDALHILRHEATLKHYLHANRDYIALGHFNANIDNAWFSRDPVGKLECGLLDWQRARQMNVGYILWGGLCGARQEIWEHHLDELLDQFIGEFHALGGPKLDKAEVRLHLDLYAATMGLAGLIICPGLVLSRLPEAVQASSPLDPIFHKNEVARSYLNVFTVLLSLWQKDDFGARVDQVLERVS